MMETSHHQQRVATLWRLLCGAISRISEISGFGYQEADRVCIVLYKRIKVI